MKKKATAKKSGKSPSYNSTKSNSTIERLRKEAKANVAPEIKAMQKKAKEAKPLPKSVVKPEPDEDLFDIPTKTAKSNKSTAAPAKPSREPVREVETDTEETAEQTDNRSNGKASKPVYKTENIYKPIDTLYAIAITAGKNTPLLYVSDYTNVQDVSLDVAATYAQGYSKREHAEAVCGKLTEAGFKCEIVTHPLSGD
jgi:hypothetical protein